MAWSESNAIAIVNNNRGADHCRAEITCSEIFETRMRGYRSPEKEVDRFTIDGQAEMAKNYQDYCAWAYDLHAGLSARDDTLPKRFLEEPMPDKPSKGQVFEQDQLLPRYGDARGRDRNGVQKPETVEKLAISA